MGDIATGNRRKGMKHHERRHSLQLRSFKANKTMGLFDTLLQTAMIQMGTYVKRPKSPTQGRVSGWGAINKEDHEAILLRHMGLR